MEIKRRKTKRIFVGNIQVGGGAPISVQSMLKTPPDDAAAAVKQIRWLERVGCEIIRIAVPNRESVKTFAAAAAKAKAPLVADIHFSSRLALAAIDAGAACVRINPGNIGTTKDYVEVLNAAKKAGISVRIGVNAGSLEKELLTKYGGPLPEALVESALRAVEIAEKQHFSDVKVSLKASGVAATIDAYRIFSKQCDAPLHVGVTEAGTEAAGRVRSAVGIGILLAEGIGDTLRVSLSAAPEEEVKSGWHILSALDIRRRGVEVVSCPTCGRTTADIAAIAGRLEKLVSRIEAPLKVAVMGCPVNGPGEAREADIGAAFSGKTALIFMKGRILKTVEADKALAEIMELIKKA